MAKSTKTVINNFVATTEDIQGKNIKRYLELEKEIAKFEEKIEPLKNEQKLIRDYFMDVLEPKEKYTSEFGYALKKESNSYSFKPELYKDFKKLFKSKVGDYVNTTTDYKPTSELKKIRNDESSEYFELANRAIVITQRHVIEIKP